MHTRTCLVCCLIFFLVLNFHFVRRTWERDNQQQLPSRYFWSGLTISPGNSLYHAPEDFISFRSNIETFKTKVSSNLSNDDSDQLWESTIEEILPLIGWNGVFDAFTELLEEGFDLPASRKHWFGKLVFEQAELPRYAIEITSRNILHQAPLHRVVSLYIIEAQKNDSINLDEFYKFIYSDLCYFREEPGFGSMFISCGHGVGHGLADLFGIEEIFQAIDICSYTVDKQFQYACASGVFMSLQYQMGKHSFEPCDSIRYPGVCFLYKSLYFKDLLESGVSNPCETISSLYHRTGCIWAKASIFQPSLKKIPSTCEPYIPQEKGIFHAACLDGVLYRTQKIPETTDKLCSTWKNSLPLSYQVCRNRTETSSIDFSLGSGEFLYNYWLLESYNTAPKDFG